MTLTVTSTGLLVDVPAAPANRTETSMLLVESPGAIGVCDPDGVGVPYTAMFLTSLENDVGTVWSLPFVSACRDAYRVAALTAVTREL